MTAWGEDGRFPGGGRDDGGIAGWMDGVVVVVMVGEVGLKGMRV